ncbi:hypothetical protein DMA12_03205 [Amycolatopsis balhimycina DSM 5908]|uniref:DUF3592 domain-containing protein n=1 Tax=Amycolatopsis balhimycina DSM 5908 TaxID=1081091 RepID=A0A428X4K3_AMYBA|nr:hypothetical protein [Amycolatopsis balhimycina]RSM50263.1 hypothetical protein DMA12_03205 [Amycolatopsis balhimycina DSM 5908]
MAAGLVAAVVSAAFGGVVLALGMLGVLEADGPAGREEATVETRGQHVDSSRGHLYDLVLRTASGEHFEVSSADAGLDLEPGLPVRLEISEVGRSVQAVEAGGRRISTGNSAVAAGIFGVLLAVTPLLFALMMAVESGRPVLAALSATAGFLAGALPVLLLF